MRSANYTLRPSRESDKAWVEQLRREAYRDLFTATWGGWDETRHARQFAESWQRGQMSIVEVAGTAVGMIQTGEREGLVEVGEIQILPSFQNRGIGREILRDLLDRAHRLGRTVVLSLGLRNEDALRLYLSLGFRETSRSATHIQMSCEPDPEGQASPALVGP